MRANLDQVKATIEQAQNEHSDLLHQYDQQRVEVHQLRSRLEREQGRIRDLQSRLDELELELGQERALRQGAVEATQAHVARTGAV